jgi:phosphonate transport system substrate-binding protein
MNPGVGGQDRIRVGIVLPSIPPSTRLPAAAIASVRVKLGVFCRALEEATGCLVQPRTFPDYAALLRAMNLQDLELAWLPPLVAARASAAQTICPLVVPLRGEDAWYHSALFARAGSPVKTLEDLKGLRAAWVDSESMAGYLVVRATLRVHGVNLASAFAHEVFLGAHEAVVEAVVSGSADVGATFVHMAKDGETVLRAGWGRAKVNVVLLGGPIPGDVLAASKGLTASRADAVRAALTGDVREDLRGAALALLEADRFVDADASRLAGLANLLHHLDD